MDNHTLKELLKEIVISAKALEIDIYMDIVTQNQQKINKNWNNNLSVNIVNNYQSQSRKTNSYLETTILTRIPLTKIATRITDLTVDSTGTTVTDIIVPKSQKL